MAYVDGAHFSEHSVNVIVYDVNKHRFIAKVSVFGYETVDKPTDYQVVFQRDKRFQANGDYSKYG